MIWRSFPQVLLQTYIEHLRGLVEEKTTINHHGRDLEVDLADDPQKPSTGENNQVFVKP